MANPFELGSAPDSVQPSIDPIQVPDGGFNSNPFEPQAKPKVAKVEKPKEAIDYIPGMRTIDNIVRRLANGATLGLMDRVAGRNENDESFKKDSPYLSAGAEIAGGILPGMGAGLAVGKALPALGKATIPSMIGNAAVSGAAMSPVEDIIKGDTDPVAMAKRAATSGAVGAAGAGAIGGLLRMLPGNKFRAAGSDLTDVDKAAMKDLAATGDRAGIPLRIPELAAERAPGRAAGVESLDNFMGRLKSGEIEKRNFDQGRLPGLSAAIDKVKSIVGSAPETGLRAQTGAKTALDKFDDLVSKSAKPEYDKAMDVVLPNRQTAPNIIEQRKNLYKNKVIEPEIRNADPNSIRVLQQTADAIEGQIKQAGNKAGPLEQNLLIGQKRGLLNEMEKASPDFAMGQSIISQGKGVGEEIAAGPLGTIKATNKPATQARALIEADPNASRKATERLEAIDPGLPRGMLATEVNALSKDPVSFGRKLAPTPEAEANIKAILETSPGVPKVGPINPNAPAPNGDFDAIKDIITAARARTKAGAPGGGENSDGPVGGIWDAIQNMSSGGVVKRMNDPKNIDKLGNPGDIQRLLQAFGLSFEDAAIDNLIRDPLVVDVKKPAKKTFREANAR